ncbi:unnamed protein product [Kuraishia capsulata CBS 1993]|uniref:5-formyltetrahydrofolate cyclo-ligase n=1 Tax=Kuraishia capsulata CBS 1993 TaxID=1382522 RepID=W6MLE3_9ASCO|nr:uncharacterized protein KUCA_T00001587001 [Kuraishia capsulata CBS 1993]CDK25617.1 unnamed protein product [Kuraishia capsulata CBS 1993]
MSKREVRKHIRKVLNTLSDARLESQSTCVAEQLRALKCYREASNVSVYLSMPKEELRTLQILANAHSDGKRVFIPRITLSKENSNYIGDRSDHLTMLLQSEAQIAQLRPRGKYALLEPQNYEPSLDAANCGGLDLVVVPGMAFTQNGARLGHGKGYYDDYIKRHEIITGRRPVLVGVALQEQILESLPLEGHDEKLDYVLVATKS